MDRDAGAEGTPAEILALIHKETLRALDDPENARGAGRQGVERSESQDVRAFLVKERDAFGRAVRELGLQMGE